MAYHKDSNGKFDKESEKYSEVFGEFDFLQADEGCNFFCPGCRNILKCKTYEEIKEEWEGFYM